MFHGYLVRDVFVAFQTMLTDLYLARMVDLQVLQYRRRCSGIYTLRVLEYHTCYNRIRTDMFKVMLEV